MGIAPQLGVGEPRGSHRRDGQTDQQRAVLKVYSNDLMVQDGWNSDGQFGAMELNARGMVGDE